MPTALRFVCLLALQVVIVLALLLAGLYAFQAKLIYPGAGGSAPPRGTAGFITARTAHGAVHYHPGKDGMPAILFMHGNGGGLSDSIAATRAFVQAGHAVAVVGYPGYDGTPGAPSEATIITASLEAYDWLKARPGNAGIYVLGNSIGGGPAVAVARSRLVSGLMLVSAFADLPGVVRRTVPFVPSGLVRDRYDNVAGIAQVKAPILLIHAVDDEVVPARDMALLSRASGSSATTRLLPKGGHQIMFAPNIQRMIENWLMSVARARHL